MHDRYRTACLIAVFAAACSGTAEKPAQPIQEPSPPPDALVVCLETLREPAESDRFATTEKVVEACAPVWTEPRCQAAWIESLNQLAGLRPALIFSECSAAYCAQAEAKLCTMDTTRADLTDDSVDWLGSWVEFNQHILVAELPDGEAVDAGQFARTLLLMVAMTPGTRHVD